MFYTILHEFNYNNILTVIHNNFYPKLQVGNMSVHKLKNT